MEEVRTCLNCNEVVRGRSDKKFCDDQCRSAYNNEINTDDISLVRDTNKILRKNRGILKSLNTSGKTIVQRKEMLKQGFDFGYFTGVLRTVKGSNYFFCYEMGYLSLKADEVLLVKKQDFPRLQG
jgi:hypothetical protein